MLLLKNLQFLPNDYETQSKLSTHEYLILTEFRNHLVKIVECRFFNKSICAYYQSLNQAAQVCRLLQLFHLYLMKRKLVNLLQKLIQISLTTHRPSVLATTQSWRHKVSAWIAFIQIGTTIVLHS